MIHQRSKFQWLSFALRQPSLSTALFFADHETFFRTYSTTIASDVTVSITSILKDRSLRGRYCDTAYPSAVVPFYLYGTPHNMHIDHILTRSPNIQLSAENIQLSLHGSDNPVFSDLPILSALEGKKKTLSTDVLDKGPILCIEGISEASMQPFQSTEGPLGDTLASDSSFFFRPEQKFNVSVYEDGKGAGEPGPGIADVGRLKSLGKGELTLGQGRYVDSVLMNRDPYEMKDGSEKFKAWKKVFDRIGKELD